MPFARQLLEFTGAGAMGTVEGPAPGLAKKSPPPPLRRLDRKRRRRAVSALLGEAEDLDDRHIPEPVAAVPPPAPPVSVEPPPMEMPSWAAELLGRMVSIERQISDMKGAPPPAPPTPATPPAPPAPKAPPLSPPVEPSPAGPNVPPRAATGAAAAVSDAKKADAGAATAALLEATGLSGGAEGALHAGVPMPAPAPSNPHFVRP